MWRKLAALAVGLLQIAGVSCHGFMADPASRNALHNPYDAPSLPAGGPGTTYANGKTWPNSQHGVCGDKHTGPKDHEVGGKFAGNLKVSRTYVQGQTIKIVIKITAPHGGRFMFGLCPLPKGASADVERKTLTQKCIDSNQLTNAKDGSRYWWFGKKTVGTHSMDFKLPPGVTCDRCVLQWHWESGNSCTLPNTPPEHILGANMVPCTQATPEEFWNCADVKVLPTGSTVPEAEKKAQDAAHSKVKDVKQDPAVTANFKKARLQQAGELRKQAKGFTGATRDALIAQAKALEDQAKGGAGEGYTNYGEWRPRGMADDSPLVVLLILGLAGLTMPLAMATALAAGLTTWYFLTPNPLAARVRHAMAAR